MLDNVAWSSSGKVVSYYWGMLVYYLPVIGWQVERNDKNCFVEPEHCGSAAGLVMAICQTWK